MASTKKKQQRGDRSAKAEPKESHLPQLPEDVLRLICEYWLADAMKTPSWVNRPPFFMIWDQKHNAAFDVDLPLDSNKNLHDPPHPTLQIVKTKRYRSYLKGPCQTPRFVRVAYATFFSMVPLRIDLEVNEENFDEFSPLPVPRIVQELSSTDDIIARREAAARRHKKQTCLDAVLRRFRQVDIHHDNLNYGTCQQSILEFPHWISLQKLIKTALLENSTCILSIKLASIVRRV